MTREQIIQQLKKHKGELDAFGVRSLSLFGSVARGEERPDSDIDILVDFERIGGLFEFVRLKNFLEQTLNKPVDLVTPDALKPQLREKILQESIHAV